MRRVALQLQVVRPFIRVVDQGAAVVTEGHRAQVGHEQQPVTGEVEIAVQGLAHHAADVGAARVVPARLQFPSDSGAANIVVFFQHHDVESGPGEIGCIGQAIVARTDNDGIVALHDRITCAALWPGAPDRPPPG